MPFHLSPDPVFELLAGKFERPEIRLFVRRRIASALLDSDAAEKEKTTREVLSCRTWKPIKPKLKAAGINQSPARRRR